MNQAAAEAIIAPVEAAAAIEAVVGQLAADHPELGLSFGYVGNIDRRWGDDRCFRIFTNRRDETGRSISYHLGGINNLPNALERMPRLIGAFIAHAKAQRSL